MQLPAIRMVLLLALLVALAAVLPAQEAGGGKPATRQPELEDLSGLIAPIREKHKMPAIGAAVIVKGKLIALGVDGIRKVGDDTPVTRADLWHLGSCTKAMTATLVGQQVAQGKLKWTTTLGEALPELRAGMHAEAREITIEQLLQHRSGLPGQPPMSQWLELFHFEGTSQEARREVAQRMLKKAPEARPGDRFLYSNAGYMIVGAVLERATGKTWQEMMRADLFAPLGMTTAGFGAPGRDGRVEQPWGHLKSQQGSKPMFTDNPPAMGPAGTVHATLEEWARFLALHLGVKAQADGPVVTEQTLAKLHQPPKDAEYASGWVVTRRDWAPGPVIWHNGSNTMWYAITWMAPELQFAVLVTCNHGEGPKACDEVAAACIRRFRR